MRSPILLTGLTGAVAVLVLLYVGLTAMNLQPQITFGDPNAQMAGIATPPPKPAAPAAPAMPAAQTIAAVPQTPVVSPPPVVTPAPIAAASPAPPAPGAVPQQSADSAAGASAARSTPPGAAQVTTPAIVPQPSVAAPPPVGPPPADVAAVAATSLQAKPQGSASHAASALPLPQPVAALPPPAAHPVAEMPTVGNEPSAPPPTAPSPVVAATSPAAAAAISERVAPQATPRVASVPTPLARPTPPATDEAAKPAAPEGLPSADTTAQIDEATPHPLPDNDVSPTDSTALTPEPETPGNESTGIAPPDGALKPVDLSRPFAERAGVLTVGGRSVQFAGIVPTDPERSCTGPNGKQWPCGTLARTALRSFVLGRTITCDVPDPAWKGTVTAECRFAKLNLGDWLARNGWAEVVSGSPFTAAADEARKAGRGVYGNDPRQKHQSTLAPAPPKEDPLNPI